MIAFRWVTAGGYVLSCRLTSIPLWLGIYLFLWWFLFVIFGIFLLHWRYELPCQDKLPEFHSTPILGCIRILWLFSHPLGLGLDKVLCGWNSVTPLCLGIEVICVSLPKNRGFSSGQMFANSQCLLKISAGLDFLSFQLNWRYPAAMASLNL